MKLYNSLTRKLEEFEPLQPPKVGVYTCGPTVYDYSHIGHMRRYVGDDILCRVLTYLGFQPVQVMNITDVGHLSSDADEGEDKLEKGAKKFGQTVWEVAKKFEKQFFQSTKALNVQRPKVVCRATEHLPEQIALIKKLEERGFVYQTDLGVYFNIAKFPNYTRLSRQRLEDLKTAARDEVVTDSEKKQPADFALWLFTKGRFKNHVMHWPSPWGEGFPGWHIECSAMSMKYLGETFDIHTGGIDHIKIHHTNEIAQSEATTGKPFVKYWVHHGFLQVENQKMSKSLGNLFTVEDILKKGFQPLVLRYLYLTAHYRQSLNFTWESLQKAKESYERLLEKLAEISETSGKIEARSGEMWKKKFKQALENDLNIPKALAVVWEMMRSDLDKSSKKGLLEQWDKVLGLGLSQSSKFKVKNYWGKKSRVKIISEDKLSREIINKIDERELARQKEAWPAADEIRKEIEKLGWLIKDTPKGLFLKKKK